MLLFNFIILQVIVFGIVIFSLRKIFYGDTQSAINRLGATHSDLLKKQKDLSEKIEATEKIYIQKKQEAETIVDKMKVDTVNEMRKKVDEMLKKGKKEADELVERAKIARDKYCQELEKEVKVKITDLAGELIIKALTGKSIDMVHHQLVKEFIDGGKDMDLTTVRIHIDKMIVKTPINLTKEEVLLLEAFIKGKLNRTIAIEEIIDVSGIAGIALQFGTLIIDGSLAAFIRTASGEEQEKIKKESFKEKVEESGQETANPG
jgi:F0F1-type ATP synthase membrane subunit b/b'